MEELTTYRRHSSCQLYHWGVDVQEGTGPISRGIIRDWIPRRGLIVDFLCPGHDEEYVPFRKVTGVSCRDRWYYTTGDAVETIVQRSSDQPWRWYPSKVLATDGGDSYAFVEIDYGDGLVREVMAPDRVRLPSGPPFKTCRWCNGPIQVLTGIRALYKHLHRHTVALSDKYQPALLAVTKKDGFLRIWERKAGVTGAKFEDGQLLYISYSKTPISEGEMKKYLRRICGLYQALRAADHTVSESGGLLGLPLELFGEILSFLDVNTQTTCRRVCRAWNTFPKGRLIHIDLTKYRGSNHQKLVTTLLNTIGSFTTTLVLSGRHLKTNRRLKHAAHMLQGMGSRIGTIILFQQDPVEEKENLWNSGQCDSALATICQELLWQQTVHGSRSRVFRVKEGNGEVAAKQWMEVCIRR